MIFEEETILQQNILKFEKRKTAGNFNFQHNWLENFKTDVSSMKQQVNQETTENITLSNTHSKIQACDQNHKCLYN